MQLKLFTNERVARMTDLDRGVPSGLSWRLNPDHVVQALSKPPISLEDETET